MTITKMYDLLETMSFELDVMLEENENKRNAIEEKAYDHDRDMTDKEQEKYDALEELYYAIENAKEYVENAMTELEEIM